MKLWLVRHAQPLIQDGCCYGQLDVPADPNATQQAAQNLAPLLPTRAALHCSGLQRTRTLAQALCDLRNTLSLQSDTRLNEFNFGSWEGIAWDHIPKAAFDAWTRDFDQHRFGGAESVRDLLVRVQQALFDLPKNKDVIWITHAGVIRAVNYLARHGIESPAVMENWPTDAPSFGTWQCIELVSQKTSTSNLQGLL
jgi:alpha-ribazole phosphatase